MLGNAYKMTTKSILNFVNAHTAEVMNLLYSVVDREFAQTLALEPAKFGLPTPYSHEKFGLPT